MPDKMYTQPGSSIENKTGAWREGIIPNITDACVECMQCYTFCPEGIILLPQELGPRIASTLEKLAKVFPGGKGGFPAIKAAGKAKPVIDYDYCKGCGICAEECPTDSIKMIGNLEAPAQEHTGYTGLGGELFAPGHSSCAGCGNALAIRYVLEGVKYSEFSPIVVSPTGCTEIFTTIFPYSSWKVPWVHSLFENSPALASGIAEGIAAKGLKEKPIVIAGDGATADIGFQSLSGMLERGHNVLYVMLDNQAYMNTGIQRSSATPLGAGTTTSVGGKAILGKQQVRKPLVEIIGAHEGVWSATASIADPVDLMAKAYYFFNNVEGPGFIQVFAPCPRGWRFPSKNTIKVAKAALETGAWLLYLINDEGKLFMTMDVRPTKDVREYLKLQGRFRHLFREEGGEELIQNIKRVNKERIERLLERASQVK